MRDKAAYILSQALSAKYYFYLFTNKHKKLVLTYLFFLLLKNVIELSRYHSKKYIKVNIFN